MPERPACLEIKRRLDGTEARFACELVGFEAGRGILLYRIGRDSVLAGVRLWPGCVSYAVYWTDRPYNVYWFTGSAGESLAFYFNIADSVELSRDVFAWRDLAVDVLVREDGTVAVLDEDELPRDLPRQQRAAIEAARDSILAGRAGLTAEVRSIVAAALSRSPRR